MEHQGSGEGMGLLQVRMGLGLGEVAWWVRDPKHTVKPCVREEAWADQSPELAHVGGRERLPGREAGKQFKKTSRVDL